MLLNKKISLFWIGLIFGTVFFMLGVFHYFLMGKTSQVKYLNPTQQNDFQINSPNIKQDNPLLIQAIQKWIDKPSKLAYNLSEPNQRDFSLGQSPLVDRIFKHKRNGFFIECGAMDGEGRSNTLFFERDRGWNGLLIEGNKLNYQQLRARNRKAHSISACASIRPYPEKVHFNLDANMGRVFQGKNDYEWAKKNNRTVNLGQSQCFPLYSMLLAMNRTTVDYFSLDVEGYEIDVLMTIPFDKVDIKVMSVEILHGPGKTALKDFLKSKGYKEIVYLPGEKIVDRDIMVRFNLDTNMGRVFQGKNDYKWAKKNNRTVNLAQSQCFPLYSMLLAMNRTTVDYFSLDVEGNELDVLKTIPFDKVDIKVMSVEILHGPGKTALKDFLKSKGYKEIVYLPGEKIVEWDVMVRFNLDTNMGRVFQGKNDYEWAKKNNRKVNLAQTQCFPLYSMLLAMNRTTVDYFSLDVEGNELDVLKTIPFDKVDIKVMSVEILHGPGKTALKEFLKSKGYKEIVYLPGEKIVEWDVMVQKENML